MEDGQLVSSHTLKMKSFIDMLERLGHPMPHDKTLRELHAMLKTVEKNVTLNSPILSLHMIRDRGKDSIAKDAECFHGEKVGHWKRNCPSYLAELKQSKQTISSAKQDGQLVSSHTLKMKSFIDMLERLGHPMPHDKTLRELHAMLKTVEKNVTLNSPILSLHMIRDRGKDSIAKDAECFHGEKVGHWKRNCPSYLAELKQSKQTISSAKQEEAAPTDIVEEVPAKN
ncbi:zinc finger, CCHC-type [Artemisia annua]|uniref:Zinc finger, CCHC-type n=1 Tax=Artemisia annua TaxID=35608 RepID=A0A2U1P7I4_ARTAN|nr:zinc finger, CCHC-type [Artemisia annua]